MMSSDDSLTEMTAAVPPLPPPNDKKMILWSCVARNEVILAEAGEDHYGGLVTQTALGLLHKRGTAGWEYHSQSLQGGLQGRFRKGGKLRGVKFHLLDTDSENIVWVFAAVYLNVELIEVQSFIEKIIGITENYRDADPEWRTGLRLACQESFAPILLQRMQDVAHLGKMAMLSGQLDSTKQIMHDNITKILEREDRLLEKATRMEQMAADFKKKTKGLRRRMMWQNAKK